MFIALKDKVNEKNAQDLIPLNDEENKSEQATKSGNKRHVHFSPKLCAFSNDPLPQQDSNSDDDKISIKDEEYLTPPTSPLVRHIFD